MTQTQTTKNRINRTLDSTINTKYFNEIPLTEIFAIVRYHAGRVVQEDGSDWSGLLCGEDGSVRLDIAGVHFHLIITWHKMPSGRYEITSYVT